MAAELIPRYSDYILEAGCDEAGRGCLAGPVFAAAVILPENYSLEGLNDSKKLNASRRQSLKLRIESDAISWAVAMLDNRVIDEINILNASIVAMHKAIEQLDMIPDFLLIDGNRFKPYKEIPYLCIVRGDSKYMNIAAASILAKTHRDEYMRHLHVKHPVYGWDTNMGYPTARHRSALAKHGITRYHRKSFRLAEQRKLFR
jgi:ribonuclease HII